MNHTLKQKIDWMLKGGFLTDNTEPKLFAYGIDFNRSTFYSINIRSIKSKNPKRVIEDVHLPLEDIHLHMKILNVDK